MHNSSYLIAELGVLLVCARPNQNSGYADINHATLLPPYFVDEEIGMELADFCNSEEETRSTIQQFPFPFRVPCPKYTRMSECEV